MSLMYRAGPPGAFTARSIRCAMSSHCFAGSSAVSSVRTRVTRRHSASLPVFSWKSAMPDEDTLGSIARSIVASLCVLAAPAAQHAGLGALEHVDVRRRVDAVDDNRHA